MRIGVKGLGLISTVVLARLLAPTDFGLVAMAMSVIAALELFRAFSFDTVLIQRQDADRTYYDTAWTLNILLGLALAVLVLAAALPAAGFYNEPRLPSVMAVLALVSFVTGFENIGVVAFRKELAFHREFALRIAQKLSALAITVPVAFALRNYWALVIGTLSSSVISVLLSYYAHPFRPRLSLAAWNHLLSFSKWLLANEFLWFLRDRSPDYLIGRIAGPDALGVFSISTEISNLPTTELVAPINRAVLPGYAKMAADFGLLREGFLNVIGLVAMLALPAGFGIAAISKVLVHVVLGDKWMAATPIVAVLAVYGGLNALTTNFAALHVAMGRPSTLTRIGIIQIIVFVPMFIGSGYAYGVIGIAWAYLLHVAIVCLPLQYGIGLSRLKLPFSRLLDLLWRPIIATAVMYGVLATFLSRAGEGSFATLVGAVAMGGATYALTCLLLWLLAGRPDGPEKTLTDRLSLSHWISLVARRERAKGPRPAP